MLLKKCIKRPKAGSYRAAFSLGEMKVLGLVKSKDHGLSDFKSALALGGKISYAGLSGSYYILKEFDNCKKAMDKFIECIPEINETERVDAYFCQFAAFMGDDGPGSMPRLTKADLQLLIAKADARKWCSPNESEIYQLCDAIGGWFLGRLERGEYL